MNMRMKIVAVALTLLCFGLAEAQETRKEKRQGRRKGATGGAVVGLAMGAPAVSRARGTTTTSPTRTTARR
jgi:hypothetical protein